MAGEMDECTFHIGPPCMELLVTHSECEHILLFKYIHICLSYLALYVARVHDCGKVQLALNLYYASAVK